MGGDRRRTGRDTVCPILLEMNSRTCSHSVFNSLSGIWGYIIKKMLFFCCDITAGCINSMQSFTQWENTLLRTEFVLRWSFIPRGTGWKIDILSYIECTQDNFAIWGKTALCLVFCFVSVFFSRHHRQKIAVHDPSRRLMLNERLPYWLPRQLFHHSTDSALRS